jgi:hypothetical protein
MSYRLLVLPRFDSMTPRLLEKIVALVEDGATVIGAPPRKSPSLSDYPNCDAQVQQLAEKLWGLGAPASPPARETGNNSLLNHKVGKGMVILDAGASAPAIANPLADARWIWSPEGNPAVSAPPGKRYFNREFEVDSTRPIQSAQAAMTADNSFELFVNGQSVGTGADFNVITTMDVGALLKPGHNAVTVVADNGDNKPNPAGLIGALHVCFSDGGTQTVNTDQRWTNASTENGDWKHSLELGASDMAPWRLNGLAAPAPSRRDLYPSYDTTAQLLSTLGVPRDFSSCRPMRYIHRREGEGDFYFVANAEDKAWTVDCRFRVTGRQPEWWDPVTGERRELTQYEVVDGKTCIYLHLHPFESGFVVFRHPAVNPPQPRQTSPRRNTMATLTAPWEVSFDPKWGGPEKVVFGTLEDWSKRPEPGIKYYSGKAVYRTTFDAPIDTVKDRRFLSLGTVKNMASVKLNGTDLGVVWCDPWRVEIPAALLREKDNQLEITVANLWINRLIGDSALPKKERLTWSTLEPFKPDSPLQESGLMGPVSIMTEVQAEQN